MYNGIGLQTARGSGTNGYVQANKFQLKHRVTKLESREFQEGAGTGGISRKANKEILEHERKRQIELKLLVLREALEEQGYTEDEIEQQLTEARRQLETASQELADGGGFEGSNQSHQLVARKEKKMETLKAALHIKEEAKEGEAFDRELQEQKRQERMLAREEAEKEKKRKEKEERKQEKERRRADKKERKQREDAEREQLRREEEDKERAVRETRKREKEGRKKPPADVTDEQEGQGRRGRDNQFCGGEGVRGKHGHVDDKTKRHSSRDDKEEYDSDERDERSSRQRRDDDHVAMPLRDHDRGRLGGRDARSGNRTRHDSSEEEGDYGTVKKRKH